jgi:hypothetical protein
MEHNMSWNDIIRRVLPPIKIDNADGTYKIFEPHTTSRYGWRTLKQRKGEIQEFHQAGDFNFPTDKPESTFSTRRCDLR